MAIRIPTIDTTSVQSRGLPTVAPVLTQANTSFAGAVEQAGQMLGRQEDIYRQRMEQARARADALVEARGLTALQAGANSILRGDSAADGTRTPGYLETQGEAAAKASRDAIDRATKQRDDIAKGMNARQKERFLARSDGVLLSFNNTIESHAGQQFRVAQKAAALGMQAETLKAIESNPGDLTLPIRMAQVESTTRELQLSPEDGDADVSAFKAKAAMAQIEGLLADNRFDIAGAEKILEEKHDDLGSLRSVATTRINIAKDRAERIESKVDAQAKVVDIARRYSDENGVITREGGDAAMSELLKKHSSDANFDQQWRMLNTQLNIAAKIHENQKKGWRNAARQQFEAGGHKSVDAIDEGVAQMMEKYDGEFFKRFRVEADLQARRAKAGKGGAKALAAADLASYRRYLAALVEDPDTDPGDWAMGRGIGDATVANMEFAHARAQKSKGKSEERGLKSFVDQVVRLTPELKSKGKAKPVFGQADDRELLAGRAAEFYADWKASHKGAEPTPAEVAEMKNDIVKEVVTEVPGRLWGTNEVKQPAFRVPRQSAPPQPQTDPKRAAAMKWLEANPNDPKAAAIRKKLGL